MSKSKKKNKKRDFRKVKLKAGRKLKKSNDTDTQFAAKKLVVLEQLRTAPADAPLTHRKQTLQVFFCKNLRRKYLFYYFYD